jgi:hypothetical protein
VAAVTPVEAAAQAGDALPAETMPFAPDAPPAANEVPAPVEATAQDVAPVQDETPAPADGATFQTDAPATVTEAPAEHATPANQESPVGEAHPDAELLIETVTPEDTPAPEATAPDA